MRSHYEPTCFWKDLFLLEKIPKKQHQENHKNKSKTRFGESRRKLVREATKWPRVTLKEVEKSKAQMGSELLHRAGLYGRVVRVLWSNEMKTQLFGLGTAFFSAMLSQHCSSSTTFYHIHVLLHNSKGCLLCAYSYSSS